MSQYISKLAPDVQAHWKRVSKVLALIVTAMGAAALAGWIFDIETLKRVHPALVTMKPNTAICLMLAGLSLWLQVDEPVSAARRWLGGIFATTLGIAGLVVSCEHLFGWDAGIDQFFFRESASEAGHSIPGRMGMATSINFFCIGMSLLFLDRSARRVFWARSLTFSGLAIVLLVFVYYFYGVEEWEPIARYASIALHTVIAFLLLGIGILLARPDRGVVAGLLEDGAGSAMARRLLPAALFAPVFVGWFCLLGQEADWYATGFDMALFAVCMMLIFSALISWTSIVVNGSDRERRQREALLQKAFSTPTVGVLFFNLDGRMTDANDAFTRMSGYSREELLHAVHWRILTAPEFFEATARRARDIAERGETAPYEKQMIRKDGSRWWGIFTPTRLNGDGDKSECVEFVIDITDHKQAELRLRESESRKSAILETALDAIITMDHEGKILDFNPAAERTFGFARKEVVGKPLADLIVPERLRQRHWQGLSHYLDTGKGPVLGKRIEMPALRADGSEFLAELSIGRMNGIEPPVFVGTLRDITKRKQAEESLRESEQRLTALINSAMDAVITIDAKQHIVLFNPAAEQMFGCTASEVLGNSVERFIPQRYRQTHQGHVERFGRTGTTARRMGALGALTGVRANGEEFPIEASISQTEVGGQKLFTVILRDVTARQRSEEAMREIQGSLAEREALLRTVTNEAQVGLLLIDQERRYLFANQTFAEILGLPSAHIVGKRAPEVLGELYDEVKPRLDRAFQTGERITYELKLPRHPKHGEEHFYEVVYEPRIADTDRPYVVVVIIDITERKRVQQTLERLVQERTAKLRETVHELEGFSYSIAHDMRAPLRAMHGFASLLDQEYGKLIPEEGKAFLQRIRASANRLDQLIHDVLDYSKVLRGDLTLKPVDIEHLLHDILESYPHLHGLNVHIEIQKPLPPVQANPAALTQVFSNLLTNAVKFVRPEVTPRVRIRADNGHNGSAVRIWFEDNGIGIPKESQRRVFEIFHQLNRPEVYPGTGMGLAIVKKAVERMGGRVGVESEPGKGSKFWVELDRANEAANHIVTRTE